MIKQPYVNLRQLQLLDLLIWREAGNQPYEGMRAVGHVVRNRVNSGVTWWGIGWTQVMLHPEQFSSFNPGSTGDARWPAEADPSFMLSCSAAAVVYQGIDIDLTQGALFYHDSSIGWPAAWGNQNDFVNTVNIGQLSFYKPIAGFVAVKTGVAKKIVAL